MGCTLSSERTVRIDSGRDTDFPRIDPGDEKSELSQEFGQFGRLVGDFVGVDPDLLQKCVLVLDGFAVLLVEGDSFIEVFEGGGTVGTLAGDASGFIDGRPLPIVVFDQADGPPLALIDGRCHRVSLGRPGAEVCYHSSTPQLVYKHTTEQDTITSVLS